MNIDFFLDKNLLVNKHTFNPSIIFDLGNNNYSNKINIDKTCKFMLSYRSSSAAYNQQSYIYIKPDNIIEYNKETNTIKFIFSKENNLFGSDTEDLEDARFTVLNKQLFLSYGLHGGRAVKSYISPFNNQSIKFSILFGIYLNQYEKNWTIFNKSNSDNIFIIYSFYNLLKIYELNRDNDLKLIKCDNFSYYSGVDEGCIRGGTSPIEIDNRLYFFCHKIKQNNSENYYKLALVVLDRDNFNMIGYCVDLLENETQKIVYCRGALYIENLKTFIIFVGVDDIDIEFLTFDLDKINSKLTFI